MSDVEDEEKLIDVEELYLDDNVQKTFNEELTDEEKKIFLKLWPFREEEKLLVDDMETMGCIITKKTFENSLDLIRRFSETIKEFGIGRTPLAAKHIVFLRDCLFCSDSRIKGRNGELVIFAKLSTFQMNNHEEMIKGDDSLMFDSYFMLFYRILIGNVDAVRNGVIMCVDFKDVSMKLLFRRDVWELKRRMYPLVGNLPMRLKMYVMFNPPWYINAVMKIARTFLSKKISDRFVSAHGPEEVLKHITGLPETMGGLFKVDGLGGLRSVLVRSDEDEKVFESVIRKDLDETSDTDEEEEENEGEDEI